MTYNDQTLDKPDYNAAPITTGQAYLRSGDTSTDAGLAREDNAPTLGSTSTDAGLAREDNAPTLGSTSTGAGLAREDNAPTLGSTSTGAGLAREDNAPTLGSTSTGARLAREDNAPTITPQPIALPPARGMSQSEIGSGSTSIGAGLV